MRGTAKASGPRVDLRPYQGSDVRHIRAAFKRRRRVLYTLPTGGGKSVVAVAIILARVKAGQRVLVLAHRRELIHQMFARLVEAGLPEGMIGVLMGEDPRVRPAAPVQVGSVDTVRKRRSRPAADLLVIDEAHRATADTYRAIVADYPSADVLGLTATPFRMTGAGLGEAFDELVAGESMEELIIHGYLARPRIWTVPHDELPDVAGVRSQAGDYEPQALAQVTNQRRLVGSIVDHWKRHAEERRTVVFAVNVGHAKKIADQFKDAGVAVEHLDGETRNDVRDGILARLSAGTTRVITNCGVLVEGWDAPPVKCAVLARPTRSLVLYLQMVGRILRPWEGVAPVILDHSGNAVVHGQPQAPRPFSLETGADKTREHAGKACPQCHCVSHANAARCDACGHEFEISSRDSSVDNDDGKLVRLLARENEKASTLARIRAVAAAKGLGEQWVTSLHNMMFGDE